MNRSQLALIVILNALISLVVALLVVWIVDTRRPDAEELAALAGVAGVASAGSTPSGAATIQLPPTATLPPAANVPAAPVTTPVPVAGETEATAGEPEIYVVQPGETLSGIAAKLGVTMQEMVDANNLTDANNIFSGQRLTVPGAQAAPTATAAQVFGTTGLKIRTVAGAGLLSNEYVEIINDTDQVFSLQGWKLQQGGGGPEYAFGDVQIFPGGSVRLYTTAGTDSTIARYWGQPGAIWSSGATAVLVNAQGERVAEYTVP